MALAESMGGRCSPKPKRRFGHERGTGGIRPAQTGTQIDAPTYVKGHFFPVGGQLRQDRDEPLDEGKLLLGQGSGRATAMVGLPAADRQIVIKATTWVPADYRARPAAGSELCARKALIDLASDIALEDSDDLGLRTALFQTALHVGLGTGIRT